MTSNSTKGEAVQRAYRVQESDGDGNVVAEHCVIATSQAQAIRHVTVGRFSAEAISALELHALHERGIKVERAGGGSEA